MKHTGILSILFLGLCLSSLAGAQTGVTLLVKTDTNCNWKLDEQPMGLLMADNPKVVLVSPGEHLIIATTADAVVTVRTKVEVDKVEKTVSIQLKSQSNQQPARLAQTPTWTDPATGLMWTREDNGSDVDWDQATAYCSKLQLAGSKDWRLPTIEELQGIHDPGISTQTSFDKGVTHDVHVKGNLKLTGSQWSSSQGEGPGKPWQKAWFFNFGDGRRTDVGVGKPGITFLLNFNWSMRALCVRRAGE